MKCYECTKYHVMSRICQKKKIELKEERKHQEFSSEELTVQNLLELLLLFKHTAAESVLGWHLCYIYIPILLSKCFNLEI